MSKIHQAKTMEWIIVSHESLQFLIMLNRSPDEILNSVETLDPYSRIGIICLLVWLLVLDVS